MTRSTFSLVRILGPLAVVAALSAGAFAYTASNTVSNSAAGAGKDVVSGYAVTEVVYDLDATDPQQLDAVKFTIAPTTAGDPAATNVKIRVVSTSTNWYDCTLVATTATCTITGTVLVADMDELNVVATSMLEGI